MKKPFPVPCLQFVTSEPHLPLAEAALRGGCRWVQLRMKDASPQERLLTAKAFVELCRHYGAVAIIDDDVEVCRLSGADGVHLGRDDMAPDEARRLLGPDAVIGATVNRADDLRRLAGQPVDYIGIGPFRYTSTKKNLAPLLGLDGIAALAARASVAAVAIGGIEAEDVAAIMASDTIAGVAVSGAIAHAADPEAATAAILSTFNFKLSTK